MRPEDVPRIAIVDHYDSYTRNLLSLLCSSVGPALDADMLQRRVVMIPYTHPALAPGAVDTQLLPFVDALMLSPGPGHPANADDFGPSLNLLQRTAHTHVPVLGVCLGHQGIATAAGASVQQLAEPFHGRKRTLQIDQDALHAERPSGMRSIMAGVADGAEVICYNSLVVDEATLPSSIRVVARSALDADRPDQGMLVQAIEHTDLPYYGIQYHPESIESHAGRTVLSNFLHNVAVYWNERDPARVQRWADPQCALPASLRAFGESCIAPSRPMPPADDQARWELVEKTIAVPHAKGLQDTLAHDMPLLVDRLFRQAGLSGCVWLDSASPNDPQSEMSMMSRAAFSLTYDMHANLALCAQRPDASVERVRVPTAGASLWDWMGAVQQGLQAATQLPGAPSARCTLSAGFAGFWGYEMKDESLDLGALDAQRYEAAPKHGFDATAVPAAEWAFCNTVLRYDHQQQTWTASALVRRDARPVLAPELAALEAGVHQLTSGSLGISPAAADAWFAEVERTLADVVSLPLSPLPPTLGLPPMHAVDNSETYMQKIRQAKAWIVQGETYELCLTTQFKGTLPGGADTYDTYFPLYTKLRRKNPAPFGAYVELLPLADGTPQAILSTSPERFLSITREGQLEMRPIKGTLARPGWGKGEEDWFARARSDPAMQHTMQAEDERRRNTLRADPKERAENLMIADLIRADLQAVCYPDSVKVPRLIALETYKTVHQLVTAVTGTLRPGIGCVEVAKRCFPPGSMTGAPKRRSVELLELLERTPGYPGSDATRRRCIYSGALGFFGVDGASNMSVVIRTVTAQGAYAMVGAGGAVTVLSTAQGEWDEVLTKLSSVSSLAE